MTEEKSVHGIRPSCIKEMEATVENNEIRRFRINAKVSFTLD